MKKASLKKILLFVSKAAVTGLLIWLVFTEVNVVELKQHFSSIKGITIVYVLTLLCAQSLLAGIRWRIVMALFDRVLSLALTVRIYFEGLFFNQALPSTVGGDGIRIYRVFKLGLPFGAAFNGVLLDRVAGFISLIILVVIAQPILFRKIQEPQALIAFWLITAFGLFAIIMLLAMGSLPSTLSRWRAIRGLVKLSFGARQLLKTPSRSIPVLGYSLIGHLLMVSAAFLIAVDIGINVSIIDCIIIVPSVMLVATVPISIGGWGLREGAMVTAFGLLGAPAAEVAALSVAFGFCLIGVSLPGGILWFLNTDHHISDAASLQGRDS